MDDCKTEIEEQIHIEENIVPLFEKLREEKLPVFIWGTGALAHWVCEYCKNFGIVVEGCFVNVAVTKTEFEGLPVFDMEEVLKEYQKISVMIGHSNYEEGVKLLRRFEKVKNIYCLSGICYGMWNLIPGCFMREESKAINELYSGLADKYSGECLKAYFEARINDKSEYMFPYFDRKTHYFTNDIFQFTHEEVLLDIGACTGAAIWPFVDRVQGKYKCIVALEPDRGNFKILNANIKEKGFKNIIVRNEGVCNFVGYAGFKGEREFAGISESPECSHRYPVTTIDTLCGELSIEDTASVIKINFPFAVPEILMGAEKLLSEIRPKLIIRGGFDERVLIQACALIRRLNPAYKIYLRYTAGLPQGLTIFAC